MDASWFLVVVALSLAKGFGDATWGNPRIHPGHGWDWWHWVTRLALWLGCTWGFWIHPEYSHGKLLIGAVLGLGGFYAGQFLGGKRWTPLVWIVDGLRRLFTRKGRSRLP